jgi:RNA recognition motif-containing protein
MDYAMEKATSLGMECTMISPVDTIEIKSRTILVKEIPLGTSKEAIQANFEEFGTIKKISWSVVGLWQKANIEFEKKEEADEAAKQWSWLIGKDAVRIIPDGNIANTLEERDRYTLKLTHLPAGTTAYDVWDYIGELGGMTCKIPRNPTTYQRLRFAIVNFENEQNMNNAL